MGSGGAQRIVFDLARLLPEHELDVEVAHLYAPDTFEAEFAALGTRVHDLSTGGAYHPLAALDPRLPFRLRHLLASNSYDVVHAHLYIAPLHLKLARTSRRARCVVVNTVHAHSAHLPSYVYPSYRLTRGTTDAFVCDFTSSVEDLRGMPGSFRRIEHVPFGIDPVEPDGAGAAALRASLGIPADDVVLLSVARLHAQRNISEFIDAFTSVPSDARCHLLLVGDGADEGRLREQAAASPAAARIHFLGRRSDLGACFGAADLYLSMSVGGDVGIAALQAASAGLAVLAWDILDTRITPTQVSVAHPCSTSPQGTFEQDLQHLVADRTTRKLIATTSTEIVRREYTADRMVERYAELYRSLVGKRDLTLGHQL